MGTLRIIAGKAKGMRIQTVPGESTRPITDRVKESLFNIIGYDLEGMEMLDLFGGTGSVSIEALSRNAAYARIIDLHPLAIKTIKANLKHTKLHENADVIKANALAYLKNIPDRQFDIIYIAPPQYKNIWIEALNEIDNNTQWLHKDGQVIVQIHPVEVEELALNNLFEIDRRKYGSTLLLFYEMK